MVKKTAAGRTGRAPVDAVDAKLNAAAAERDVLCVKLAQGDASVFQAMLDATTAVAALQFERGEIIRKFFYGTR